MADEPPDDPALELYLCARGTHRFRTVRTKLQKGPPYYAMQVCRNCPAVLSLMLAWKHDKRGYPKPYTEVHLHVLDRVMELSTSGYRCKGRQEVDLSSAPADVLRVLQDGVSRSSDEDLEAEEESA